MYTTMLGMANIVAKTGTLNLKKYFSAEFENRLRCRK
jgi:hypothetical protein